MKNFINRLMAEGCSPVAVAELGPIPPMPHRPWEPGCTIYFPKEARVFVKTSNTPYGDKCCLPFVAVLVTFPDSEVVFDKLFLTTLVKTVHLPGSTAVKTTRGTAADFIRQFPSWPEALVALSGRTIKVTTDEVYEVTSPDGMFHHNTHLYGFDLAD